jgi:hypothetical protein
MTRYRTRSTVGAALLALLFATPAAAQVGHTPEGSPYRDLEFKEELGVYGGTMSARSDRAGVLPQSGPLVGLRYQVHIAGPISFAANLSSAFSQRNVIDPTKPAASRLLRTEDVQVYAADVGLALAVTGRKSWHFIVPEVRAGVGALTTSKNLNEAGYRFGTPFAFTLGGGLRLVGRGRLQLRADVSERLFKQKYPPSFFTKASDNTAVVSGNTQSFWTNHTLLSVGLSFLFDR